MAKTTKFTYGNYEFIAGEFFLSKAEIALVPATF